MLHHFQYERYGFGVTHPLAGAVMGTWKDPAAVERSPIVRTLGARAD